MILYSNKLQVFLLFSLITVTAVQYSSYGIEPNIYNRLRLITIIIVGILVGTVLITGKLKEQIHNPVLQSISKYFLSFIILFLFVYSIGARVDSSAPWDILIILIISALGGSLSITEKDVKILFNIFCFFICFSSFSILLTYGDGFSISEYYMPIHKNQLAPLFSSLLFVSVSNFYQRKRRVKYFWLLISTFLFFSLLILRARATIIAIIPLLIIYTLTTKNLSKKEKKIYLILFGCVAIFCFNILYVVFLGGKDAIDINDVSSGRIVRNIYGWKYFINHFFFGSLFQDKFHGEIIHLFLLKLLVDFGVILSFPLFIIYFKLLILSVKNIRTSLYSNSFDYAPYMVLLLFTISLFEYSYPFSPISSTYPSYLLFSFYLKNKQINNKTFLKNQRSKILKDEKYNITYSK
ncbi:hypothetical protein HR11_08550 [Porphyromonas macacae]|uniref:hypothetical protein n=1 Tax=Porphyromonas macacae TaxID=28115 RepID=UPI00052C22B9|nr:hypothetical protein [Porphyromonas macacae]KGN98572.1 hypothetical protein HR11_08550 [Porphyromonas macacae]